MADDCCMKIDTAPETTIEEFTEAEETLGEKIAGCCRLRQVQTSELLRAYDKSLKRDSR